MLKEKLVKPKVEILRILLKFLDFSGQVGPSRAIAHLGIPFDSGRVFGILSPLF